LEKAFWTAIDYERKFHSGDTKTDPVNPFVAKPHISQYFEKENPIYVVVSLLNVKLA